MILYLISENIFFIKWVFMNKSRVMLTSALRVLVKNPIKKSFYGKRKKIINVLIAFFISHKSDIKTFFIGFLTSVLRALVSISHKSIHSHVIKK